MTENITRRRDSLSVLTRRQRLVLDEARLEHATALRELADAETSLEQERRRCIQAQSELESLLLDQGGIDLEMMTRVNAFVQTVQSELQASTQRVENINQRAEDSSQQLSETALVAKLFEDALAKTSSDLSAVMIKKEQASDMELWLSSQFREMKS